MPKLPIAAIAAMIAVPTLVAAQSMTAQQYHQEIGPCACPDDKDKAGNRCGARSAFCHNAVCQFALCQNSGVEIKNCYLKDVEKRKKDSCG
jgi:hypothetical protein